MNTGSDDGYDFFSVVLDGITISFRINNDEDEQELIALFEKYKDWVKEGNVPSEEIAKAFNRIKKIIDFIT